MSQSTTSLDFCHREYMKVSRRLLHTVQARFEHFCFIPTTSIENSSKYHQQALHREIIRLHFAFNILNMNKITRTFTFATALFVLDILI